MLGHVEGVARAGQHRVGVVGKEGHKYLDDSLVAETLRYLEMDNKFIGEG
jgi:hypothetical protein